MSATPLPLEASHLRDAVHDLDQAAHLIARAGHNIEAALAAQPRNRRGHLLRSDGLRLWGAANALTTATGRLNTARRTCGDLIDEESP